jgi:hypothetical protein
MYVLVDAGQTTRKRFTVPLASNGHRMRPASIVFPRPTSSATSQRAGQLSSTDRYRREALSVTANYGQGSSLT